MAVVINRTKSNQMSDILGGLGKGMSGFAGGYMGRKQMDMAQKQSDAMTKFYDQLLSRQGAAYPGGSPAAQNQPTIQPVDAFAYDSGGGQGQDWVAQQLIQKLLSGLGA